MTDPHQPASPAAIERPNCIAIVICNEVIEDKRTNNKTLVGLFNRIEAPQLPATHPRMFIMASLTNGLGHWPITFRISSPSGKEIMRVDGQGDFQDPLVVADLVVEVRGLTLEEEGIHFVDLYVGSEISNIQRRFAVERGTWVAEGGQQQT